MLSATEQCDGLESTGTLAGLHSVDRGRVRLSHSEVRSAIATDLAQETEAGRGEYLGVLPGLRVVEDPGAALSACRVGRRTAKSFSGTGGGGAGRRGTADAKRGGSPQALHQSPDRASGHSAAAPTSRITELAGNDSSVVKTRACPH